MTIKQFFKPIAIGMLSSLIANQFKDPTDWILVSVTSIVCLTIISS